MTLVPTPSVVAPTPFPTPTFVSRPILPPLDSYTAALAGTWNSKVLTNLGPAHERLERAIGERVGAGHVTLWNNGTVALLAALSQLDLHGEVIVTPFTFPATIHAIALLGLTPVFADIDPVSMTIDPICIAEKITSRTSAIVGTHIYGIACDTEAIARLASDADLRVVYDGAHSFGRPAPTFQADVPSALGDVTMLSFHATKLFHTVEGGALVTPHADLNRRLRQSRNFGILDEETVTGVGLNGKMSELHAIMGLLTLEMLDEEIARRALVAEVYLERLSVLPGIDIVAGTSPARQYFVVRVKESQFGSSRDDLHTTLKSLNIMSRKYFYPLCSDIDIYSSHPSAARLPHARLAAEECLALPFYGELSDDDVHRICDAIEWHARRVREA